MSREIKKNRFARTVALLQAFAIILTLSTLSLFTACLFDYDDKSENEGVPPHVVAVANDASISANENRIPELTLHIIDTFLSLVRRRSGEFAFANIEAKKPHLIRLRFLPEKGTAQERERRRLLNDRQLSRVRQAVYESIQERSAQRTRLFDTIELMLTFLKEPHLPPDAERILIIISDFIDDVRLETRRQPIQIPENVTVLALGADPLTIETILDGQGRVFPYTTIEGIIDFLSMEVKK